MKLNKNQRSNLIFLAIIILFLFTPVGKYVKVQVNRLLAFSPSVTKIDKRKNLVDYSWDLRSLNGDIFNLEAAKGKVIIVNLWATWCPPCIAEMPSLQKLYNDYKDEVVFAFVSDEETAVIRDFLSDKTYDLPVYHPRSRVPDALFSRSIPATYLIDKKGSIVIAEFGAADWHSQKVKTLIDTLLSEPEP